MSDQSEALLYILKNKPLVQQHMRKHEQTWAQPGVTQPSDSVQVYIRSRPLLQRELDENYYSLLAIQPPYIAHITHPTIRWAGGRFGTNTYQADCVFAENTTSEEVYRTMNLSTRVEKCVEEPGSNLSLIAYGQTGSGKTYSTTAIEEFAVEDLFSIERVKNASVTISLGIFEIRGNLCYDLLSEPALAPVKISTSASQDVVYGNLSIITVQSKDEMLECIQKAKGLRLTRSTVKNDTSSRSHCIIMMDIRDTTTSKRSRLQIVDLAGSERFKDVTRNNQDRVKESIEVNKSLAALKDCVRSRLSEGATFTPWRSTKLTTVLRESLDRASNGTVIVLACISPSPADLDDTLNTLKWVMPFQIAVNGGMETRGGSSGILDNIKGWSHEESIAYFRRNFPKLAPFIPRLFPTEDVTIADLCCYSLAEFSKALDTPAPSETVAPDARSLNQAKALLLSTHQRLQRLLEQKDKAEKVQTGPRSAATPSGSVKEAARVARNILSGRDGTAAETGLVTRFNAKGDLVEEQLPPKPSAAV